MEASAFEAEVRELHAFLEGWFAGTADLVEFAGLDMLDDRSQMIGAFKRSRIYSMSRLTVALDIPSSSISAFIDTLRRLVSS